MRWFAMTQLPSTFHPLPLAVFWLPPTPPMCQSMLITVQSQLYITRQANQHGAASDAPDGVLKLEKAWRGNSFAGSDGSDKICPSRNRMLLESTQGGLTLPGFCSTGATSLALGSGNWRPAFRSGFLLALSKDPHLTSNRCDVRWADYALASPSPGYSCFAL